MYFSHHGVHTHCNLHDLRNFPCWRCFNRFSVLAPSFRSTVGAYRYYRQQG